MSDFDRVAALPLTVEAYDLERREQAVSSGFTRVTTILRLHGGGHTGSGEDVVYDAEDHDALQAAGPVQPLAGDWTLGDFCGHVAELDLFGAATPPLRGEVSRLYRRWAFDSAALDLALRQAGTTLGALIGREPVPVTFVVSLRLDEPPDLGRVTRRLERYPRLRFKLDATPSWDDELIATLRETGSVDSIDLKGLYRGTEVDNRGEPGFYRRIAEGFPDAWIEDPDLEPPGCAEALEPHRDRVTWDAPIHGIADIEAQRWKPRMVNVKPSRLGGLRPLLECYAYCEREGIGMYGGGQYELGVGRSQVQELASLFHPLTPNDIAPLGYDADPPEPGLPESPLSPRPPTPGFGAE